MQQFFCERKFWDFGGTGMGTNSFMQGKRTPVRTDASRKAISVPADLPDAIKPIFRRLARQLADRTTPEDSAALAQLAVAEYTAALAAADIAENGILEETDDRGMKRSAAVMVWKQSTDAILSIAAHFGATPASRARLRIGDDDSEATLEDVLYE